MGSKERHSGHPNSRRPDKRWVARPDLNTMPHDVVHDVAVRPNGSVDVHSSPVSFEGYVGGGPSGRINEANPLARLGLVKSEA